MHRGYIKYWRKIEEWSWYKDSNTKSLFLHLVASANHKDTVFMGVPVPRGSIVVGRYALSDQTGISVQSLRTCFKRLKSTHDITIKSTHRFSVICIVNYELYQDKSTHKSTHSSTSNQPAINSQLTTSKECKNEKNEKKGNTGDFLKELKANDAYKGIDIDRELGKCKAWCLANGKQLNQRRFVNWINRAEKPILKQAPVHQNSVDEDAKKRDQWKKEAAPMPKECRDQLKALGIRSKV